MFHCPNRSPCSMYDAILEPRCLSLKSPGMRAQIYSSKAKLTCDQAIFFFVFLARKKIRFLSPDKIKIKHKKNDHLIRKLKRNPSRRSLSKSESKSKMVHECCSWSRLLHSCASISRIPKKRREKVHCILACVALWWPITVTAKPKTSRQNHKPHGKTRQNQKPHGKTKNVTSKPKTSGQKQNTSRQNRKPHGKNQIPHRKTKYFTAKTK